MFDEVVGSKVAVRVLRALSEQGELHVSAAARAAGVSKSQAGLCLRLLAERGIMERREAGRSVLYRPAATEIAKAAQHAVFEERALLRRLESAAAAEARPLRPLSVALFGSVARRGLRRGSDVDILVISEEEPGSGRLAAAAARLTERFGLPVSVIGMRPPEFRKKGREGEEFVLNVMADGKVLAGKPLEEVVWPRK